MESGDRLKAVIIGSGNVASAMAPVLERDASVDIVAVYSPDILHASELSRKLRGAVAVDSIADVPRDAGFYLVSVKDDAVESLAHQVASWGSEAVWAHTSGSVRASVFSEVTLDYGVFYPLQTFSKGVTVDFAEVPMFIDASNEATRDLLLKLARCIAGSVYEANDEARAKMHTAAVFACNFVNHLWAVADDILHREMGLDITMLSPLVRETLRKAFVVPPAQAQTGPAMRGDSEVMRRHLAMLTDSEARLYDILSKSIMDYHGIK